MLFKVQYKAHKKYIKLNGASYTGLLKEGMSNPLAIHSRHLTSGGENASHKVWNAHNSTVKWTPVCVVFDLSFATCFLPYFLYIWLVDFSSTCIWQVSQKSKFAAFCTLKLSHSKHPWNKSRTTWRLHASSAFVRWSNLRPLLYSYKRDASSLRSVSDVTCSPSISKGNQCAPLVGTQEEPPYNSHRPYVAYVSYARV